MIKSIKLFIYVITIHVSFIFSSNANCNVLLPGAPLQSCYWTSLFVLLGTISLIIYYSASTKITVQTCVAIHALVNIFAMLILTLLVLIAHYTYGLNYPLLRSHTPGGVACVLHSSLSIITYLIPSSSLVLTTITHYRAVFWVKFSYKLQIKNLLYPILVTWLVTLTIAALWTPFHGLYISWYCIPFTSSHSWLSTILQSLISIICMISLGFCVGCYSKIVIHLHNEEKIVKSMRTHNISNTKSLAIRFVYTFLLHLAQSIVMHSTMWLPWFGYDESLVALTNIMYILTVTVTDIYFYARIPLKKMLFSWIQPKKSK